MESILSIHEDVYSLKSRRRKTLAYLSNTNHIKINPLNNRKNSLSLFYQYLKRMVTQRLIYIVGVFNLILASVAIICVIQAEDHPEHFPLVYIAISIFIFYMATIIFIIVLQIVETYQEQHMKKSSSLSIQMPLLTPTLTTQPNPIVVESIPTKTKPKTRLSRSQTLPLTSFSLSSHQTLSNSASSSTRKDFQQMTTTTPYTRFGLSPKYQQSITNIPKTYESFALTTNDQLYRAYSTKHNKDSDSQLSPLIKPTQLKPKRTFENNKPKIKFLE